MLVDKNKIKKMLFEEKLKPLYCSNALLADRPSHTLSSSGNINNF